MKITSISVKDVRFPTSRKGHGTDAMVIHISLFVLFFNYLCVWKKEKQWDLFSPWGLSRAIEMEFSSVGGVKLDNR